MRTSDFDPVFTEGFQRQLKRATWVVLVVFGLLILRLWYLQIAKGHQYRIKSESNRIHLRDISPFRGLIFDCEGEILVKNRPSYDLYVIPEDVPDQKQLLDNLARFTSLDPLLVKERLGRSSPRYSFRPVCLKQGISRDELAVIEGHRFNLPGIMIRVKPQRHYVYGDLAAHLLGYLGEITKTQLNSGKFRDNKPGDLVGKAGIEKQWQARLNGLRGGEQVEVDASGRTLRVISRKSPMAGANVYLTIDKDLQFRAERALKGKRGAVVALNPSDGRILAVASSPSFDPNLFVKRIDWSLWKKIASSEEFPLQNRALSGQYPPASVFKIVVALAALEEGVIGVEEEFTCPGFYTLGRERYRCWKKSGHGEVDLHRALVESCDVFFYKLGIRLGIDTIAEYARKLGLGEITGFNKEQEKAGLIPTRDWKLKRFGIPWQTGETVSAAIGQSFVLVTPIQMATMVSAVFNGGVLYRPQATAWVGQTPLDDAVSFSPEVIGETGISRESLEFVKKALVDVVNGPGGTGRRARLRDVTVAGKTGTAQVVAQRDEDSREDEEIPREHRDHAWFVAVAPSERPVIAVAVIVEHGGHGGSTAAPIAKDLIEGYLGIDSPDVSPMSAKMVQ